MKCWECKSETSKAHIVHYISYNQDKEKRREICPDCYPKLQFNPCHYIEVDKITQRSIKAL